MNCNVKDLKAIIDVDKDEILNQLRMHMEMSRLIQAIEAYNFDECEGKINMSLYLRKSVFGVCKKRRGRPVCAV